MHIWDNWFLHENPHLKQEEWSPFFGLAIMPAVCGYLQSGCPASLWGDRAQCRRNYLGLKDIALNKPS